MDGWGVSGVSCDVFSSVEHLRIPKQRPQESIIVDVQSLHEKLRDRCCVADFFFWKGNAFVGLPLAVWGLTVLQGGYGFPLVCVCVTLYFQGSPTGFASNSSRGVWHSRPTTNNEAADESGKQGLIIPVHHAIEFLSFPCR